MKLTITFYITKKLRQICKDVENKKSFYYEKKDFSSLLKRFQLSEIVYFYMQLFMLIASCQLLITFSLKKLSSFFLKIYIYIYIYISIQETLFLVFSEAVFQEVFCKQGVFKILFNRENASVRVAFLIKLQACTIMTVTS